MTAPPIITGDRLVLALERLWGWPTNRAQKAFPNFGAAHLVPPEKIPPLSSLTIWMAADPHGDRNWFMNWTGVDQDERKWTFAEWPDPGLGEWALPGSRQLAGKPAFDGKPGPAQSAGGGKGFNDYQRLILETEGWRPDEAGRYQRGPGSWDVFDRQMDPRPAGTYVPNDVEARTYLDHMNTPVLDGTGREQVPGLDFHKGPGCENEEGKGYVNDWINGGWNASQPVTPLNMPRWFISTACVNTLWSLRTWTGRDGDKGASKDPIDCLKMLAKSDIRYVPKGALGTYTSAGGY